MTYRHQEEDHERGTPQQGGTRTRETPGNLGWNDNHRSTIHNSHRRWRRRVTSPLHHRGPQPVARSVRGNSVRELRRVAARSAGGVTQPGATPSAIARPPNRSEKEAARRSRPGASSSRRPPNRPRMKGEAAGGWVCTIGAGHHRPLPSYTYSPRGSRSENTKKTGLRVAGAEMGAICVGLSRTHTKWVTAPIQS